LACELTHVEVKAAAAFELEAVNCTLLPDAQFAFVTVVDAPVEQVTVPTALDLPDASSVRDWMILRWSFSL